MPAKAGTGKGEAFFLLKGKGKVGAKPGDPALYHAWFQHVRDDSRDDRFYLGYKAFEEDI